MPESDQLKKIVEFINDTHAWFNRCLLCDADSTLDTRLHGVDAVISAADKHLGGLDENDVFALNECRRELLRCKENPHQEPDSRCCYVPSGIVTHRLSKLFKAEVTRCSRNELCIHLTAHEDGAAILEFVRVMLASEMWNQVNLTFKPPTQQRLHSMET